MKFTAYTINDSVDRTIYTKNKESESEMRSKHGTD